MSLFSQISGFTATFSLGIFFLSSNTHAACTFPSYMTGNWYDSRFDEVQFLGNTGMYFPEYAVHRISTTSNLTCHSSSEDTYIVRTVDSFLRSSDGKNYYYYLCMKITQVTSYSFYYYLLTARDTNGERVYAKKDSETVSSSDACDTTIETTFPESLQVMVRQGYESDGVSQFADPFLGNFKFKMEAKPVGDSFGNITGCNSTKTAYVIYDTSASVSVAFSSDKYYGCIAAVTYSSVYYSMWVNFDQSANFRNRFACVVATYNGSNVDATQRERTCIDGQTSTDSPNDLDSASQYPEKSIATKTGKMYLEPYIPTTATSDDSSNAGVIAAVVVVLLLLIAAAVGAFLFWKYYWKPKKEREAKLLEEQKKPRSHIGMMKSAVHAGYGGGIRGDKNAIINMVDIEEEGVEGSVTGHHPNTFKEQNNNFSDKAKRTSTPATPSAVEPEISDPNSIPEKPLLKEKTKLTTGFAADMKGTTTTDTPKNTTEQNGIVLNGSIPKDNVKPQPNVAETARTPNVVSNGNINPIQREPSMNVGNKRNEPQNKITDRPPSDRKTTVATVSPFMEEKPVVETATKQTSEKREEKLRKSVTFAGDKQVPEPDPITLPREPSNLLGPRDTTLPEIDLKGNDLKGF